MSHTRTGSRLLASSRQICLHAHQPVPTQPSILTRSGRQCIRSISNTTSRPASHGPSYDQPTGWLFGVKPGEKYQKEGWENIWYFGFFGSMAACAIGYIYKPDTSIQTWALEEARRRLEKEGYLTGPSAREG